MPVSPRTFWWVRVRTATHVIYDRSEAKSASFDCFYDEVKDVENARVRKLFGYDTFNLPTASKLIHKNDACDVLCVTHDRDVASVLFSNISPAGGFFDEYVACKTYAPSKIIVSHPHGCFKRITTGNVLHLTAPIDHNYPMNTPLPFKEGTVYRAVQSVRCEDEKRGDEIATNKDNCQERDKTASLPSSCPSLDDKDEFISSQDFSMKEKLEKIKVLLDGKISNNELNQHDGENHDTCEPMSYDDYLVDFYFTLIREKVLMFLIVSSVVHQKITSQVADPKHELMKKAFQDFYEIYLDKSPPSGPNRSDIRSEMVTPNNATSNTGAVQGEDSLVNSEKSNVNDDPNSKKRAKETNAKSDLDESNPGLREWHRLLDVCEKEFARVKHDMNKIEADTEPDQNESILMTLFVEIEKIMQTIRSDLREKGKYWNENVLPLIFDRSLVSYLEVVQKREGFHKTKATKSEINKASNKSGTSPEIDKKGAGSGQDSANANQKSVAEQKKNASNSVQTDAKDAWDNKVKDTGVLIVPPGSRFILPPDAKYAFRMYHDKPGWITFPSGTVMIHQDGEIETSVPIGKPLFEFQANFFVPEQSYVTYDIETCPGSSGATVYCDSVIGTNILPIFPHSGFLKGCLNRSGMKDNVFSLHYKQLISNAIQIMMAGLNRGGGGETPKAMPHFLDSSKQVILFFRQALKKSFS